MGNPIGAMMPGAFLSVPGCPEASFNTNYMERKVSFGSPSFLFAELDLEPYTGNFFNFEESWQQESAFKRSRKAEIKIDSSLPFLEGNHKNVSNYLRDKYEEK
ncbi:MAG: hypothetical protein P1V97_29705 [Planctomycetota bacterium]|nr:hypothetical protein [Planctomycetota bacterium]